MSDASQIRVAVNRNDYLLYFWCIYPEITLGLNEAECSKYKTPARRELLRTLLEGVVRRTLKQTYQSSLLVDFNIRILSDGIERCNLSYIIFLVRRSQGFWWMLLKLLCGSLPACGNIYGKHKCINGSAYSSNTIIQNSARQYESLRVQVPMKNGICHLLI